MSAGDDDQAQVNWCKLFLPTYRRIRQQGSAACLDAYLCGLVVAYADQFQRALNVKLGTPATEKEGALWMKDVFTVRKFPWDRLYMLSSLLLRLYLSEPLTRAPSSTSTPSASASRSDPPVDAAGVSESTVALATRHPTQISEHSELRRQTQLLPCQSHLQPVAEPSTPPKIRAKTSAAHADTRLP
ncbi:hypothetical protein DFS33DRAFT_1275349 [Desarmillaria ectypa]|nr:hypothetical protein DFS33DRAFT_1275349 [Desarmillaria ectypa]